MGRSIGIFLVFLMMILYSAMAGEGAAAMTPVGMKSIPAHAQTVRSPGERDEITRIVSILELRIGSQRLPAQAKDKLAVMPQKDVRLIKALCDRITATADGAGADLAVLLAAALIVLS